MISYVEEDYLHTYADLSKAFECVNHDLLIIKLDACGLDRNALKLVHSYLSDRKHGTKTHT